MNFANRSLLQTRNITVCPYTHGGRWVASVRDAIVTSIVVTMIVGLEE